MPLPFLILLLHFFNLAMAAPAVQLTPKSPTDGTLASSNTSHGWCSFHGVVYQKCDGQETDLLIKGIVDGNHDHISNIKNEGRILSHAEKNILNIGAIYDGFELHAFYHAEKDEAVFWYGAAGQQWTDKSAPQCKRGDWDRGVCDKKVGYRRAVSFCNVNRADAKRLQYRQFDCGFNC